MSEEKSAPPSPEGSPRVGRKRSCLIASCLGCASIPVLGLIAGLAFFAWVAVPYDEVPLRDLVRPEHDVAVHVRPGPSKPLLVAFVDRLHLAAARARARRLPPGLREIKVAKDRSDFRPFVEVLQASDPSFAIFGAAGTDGSRRWGLTLSLGSFGKAGQLLFDFVAALLPPRTVLRGGAAPIAFLGDTRHAPADPRSAPGLTLCRGQLVVGHVEPILSGIVKSLTGGVPSGSFHALAGWCDEGPHDFTAALDNRGGILDALRAARSLEGAASLPSTTTVVSRLVLVGVIEGNQRLAVTLVCHPASGADPAEARRIVTELVGSLDRLGTLRVTPGDPEDLPDGRFGLTFHLDGVSQALDALAASIEGDMEAAVAPRRAPAESR